MRRTTIIFWMTLAIFAMLYSCKDKTTTTTLDPSGGGGLNPFDTINYDTGVIVDVPVDSSTFLGLHTYIFSQRCNQPACHDGTFEPDFRTVQSAYNTLVYHPVVKNYDTGALDYRVTPGDPQNSMIFHRLTINNPPNFERMPSSGLPLPQSQIDLISNWISDGAKDIYGNEPSQTSQLPNCYGVVVFEHVGNDTIRVDTMRQGTNVAPFVVLGGNDLDFWFVYTDFNVAGEFVPGYLLTYNKFKISNDPVDFSNAIELDMSVEFQEPLWINAAYSEAIAADVPYFQKVTFNPATYGFSSGERLYFRSYVQDDDHTEPAEIPLPDSPTFMHSYFSFDIQ